MSQPNRPPVEIDSDIAAYLERHFPGAESRFYYPVKIGSTPDEARQGARLVLG